MSAKHTPGPWIVGKDGKYRAFIADLHMGVAVWTERRFEDGEAFSWGDREKDAHLIAAAPDMLAALKAAVKQADANHTNIGMRPEVRQVYDACVAAIAKAEAGSG